MRIRQSQGQTTAQCFFRSLWWFHCWTYFFEFWTDLCLSELWFGAVKLQDVSAMWKLMSRRWRPKSHKYLLEKTVPCPSKPRCWQVGFVLWLAMKQGLTHWEGGAFNQGQAKVWVINEFSKARRACKVGSEQYCATAQPVTHAIYLAKSIDTTWHRHLKYIASSVTSRVTSRNCQQFFGLGDLGRLFQPCSTVRTWLVSSAGAMDSLVPGFSLSLKFFPLLDAWSVSMPDVYPGPYGEEASVCFGASIV